MTIYEQRVMDTIINEIPKIRKALESINSNLEKLAAVEEYDEQIGDTLLWYKNISKL